MKTAAVGAQTVRRGVALAGEALACRRGLTGRFCLWYLVLRRHRSQLGSRRRLCLPKRYPLVMPLPAFLPTGQFAFPDLDHGGFAAARSKAATIRADRDEQTRLVQRQQFRAILHIPDI